MFYSSEIIEIGAVKLDSHKCVVDQFSILVKPQYNEEIALFVTKLTGIDVGAVKKACDFEQALSKFSEWIGHKKTRMYSWSNTDLIQLRRECTYKNIRIPENMIRWMDFQVVYPKVMGLDISYKMSLANAAEWYGVEINKRKAHRALYDAEITAELVRPVLTGEYKKQAKLLHDSRSSKETVGNTLGESFNVIFQQFMKQSRDGLEHIR